jgi:hypothetical protein
LAVVFLSSAGPAVPPSPRPPPTTTQPWAHSPVCSDRRMVRGERADRRRNEKKSGARRGWEGRRRHDWDQARRPTGRARARPTHAMDQQGAALTGVSWLFGMCVLCCASCARVASLCSLLDRCCCWSPGLLAACRCRWVGRLASPRCFVRAVESSPPLHPSWRES